MYDVIIIGGGVSGAMLAAKLAQKDSSLSIVILEAGADRTSERVAMSLGYAYSMVKTPGSPYNKNPLTNLPFPDITKPGKSDYYRYETNSTEFKSTYVKLGGGTTWHFLGNVPRFLPNDFKLHSMYGVGEDWPIGYEDLKAYYREAEVEMGVSGNTEQWKGLYEEDEYYSFPMPEIWPSYSDTVLSKKIEGIAAGGKTISVRSTPQARNSQGYQGRPACAGNSSCVPICPIGAKYDASIHLKKSKEAGVSIKYKSIVFRIESNADGIISKVHFKDWEKNESFLEGKIVVVANHAIESAMLLLYSKVANSSGIVGKNLMDHPQGYGVGLSDEPLFPFRGPPTTSGIDVFRDGAQRKDTAAFRISIGNDGWGRWKGVDKLEAIIDELTKLDGEFVIGEELKSRIEYSGTRIFRFSYSTEMLPDIDNYVTLHETDVDPVSGTPLPKINFKIDRTGSYNQNAFQYASSVLQTLLTIIGAKDAQTISNISEFSGAGHIMGTTKMGKDAKTAVVDSNCRSFDHPNLYIVGPGVFTTCGTANPTLTSTALSLRLADHIYQLFQSKQLPVT